MKYSIVIEKAEHNYAAYSPDVDGCVATGDTIESVKQQIAEALEFHFEGLLMDKDPIPSARTIVDYVEVNVPTNVPQL